MPAMSPAAAHFVTRVTLLMMLPSTILIALEDAMKLSIRLPGDPNPYDSSLPPSKPKWLDWKWWLGIVVIAGVWYGIRVMNGTAI